MFAFVLALSLIAPVPSDTYGFWLSLIFVVPPTAWLAWRIAKPVAWLLTPPN
jgi:hypothetical protein